MDSLVNFKKAFLLSLLLYFKVGLSFAQQQNHCPEKLKNGHFYSYSSKLNAWSEIFRDGRMQKEIFRNTNDTSVYSIRWVDSCTYEILLLKSTTPFEPGEEDFVKSFKTVVSISSTSNLYYTNTSVVSSEKYRQSFNFIDTVWFDKESVLHRLKRK